MAVFSLSLVERLKCNEKYFKATVFPFVVVVVSGSGSGDGNIIVVAVM